MKTKAPAILFFVIIMSLSAICRVSAVTELVTNGGFETGDFTGWTQSGDTAGTSVETVDPNSGTYSAFFGPTGDLGFISQDLNTTANATYTLTFFLKDENNESEEQFAAETIAAAEVFQVFWNGALIDEIDVPPDTSPSVFTQFTFNALLATGPTTTLEFGFRNDPSYWDIDDISVTAEGGGGSGVPESFSTLWLALPIAGMIALLRLRKATA